MRSLRRGEGELGDVGAAAVLGQKLWMIVICWGGCFLVKVAVAGLEGVRERCVEAGEHGGGQLRCRWARICNWYLRLVLLGSRMRM